MGWCAEFGCRIRDGCDHTMVAGRKACTCPSCAVVCTGRFNGCPEVWLAGPRTGEQPVLKVVANAARLEPSEKPQAVARPEPAPAAVAPPDERVTAALDSIRHDVEGVHLDLSDTILGLKDIRGSVDEVGRNASASIESLRRDLAAVTRLLTEQQATLDKLIASQAASVSARTSYDKLVEERRQRMAAAAAAAEANGIAGGIPNGNGLGGRRGGLLPRIQRSLHNGHPDPDPDPDPGRPTLAPDLREADRPSP